MRKILKITYRSLLIVFSLIVIFFVIAFFLSNIYKNDIQNFVIREINKNIELKINVSSIDISVIQKFPFISVVLSNSVALSSENFNPKEFNEVETDTLFTASKIYLQFNLIDLIRKDYRIRRIQAVNGNLSLLADQEGRINYTLFRQGGKNNSNNLTIELQGVKINGFKWRYINLAKKINSEGIINDLSLKGKFSSNEFSMDVFSSLLLKDFTREGIRYANQFRIGTRFKLDVKDSLYKISNGDLILNRFRFKTTGSFNTGSKNMLDLKVSAYNIDVKSFMQTLPENLNPLDSIVLGGRASVMASVSGAYNSMYAPLINAVFVLKNGYMLLADQNTLIKTINLKGSYTNGSKHNAKTSNLNINEFDFSEKQSRLKGSLSFSDFTHPRLKSHIYGKLNADIINQIFKTSTFKLKSGNIRPDITAETQLESFRNFNLKEIFSTSLSGNILIDSLSFDIPGYELPIEQLKGKIIISGYNLNSDINLKAGKNNIHLVLETDNLLSHFLRNNSPLTIKGSANAGYINLKQVLTSGASMSDSSGYHLPKDVFLNITCHSDTIDYDKFRSTDNNFLLNYRPFLLTGSDIKFNSMEGSMKSEALITEIPKGILNLKIESQLKDININQLFTSFNNFGQDFLVADNLQGKISGNIDYSSDLDKELIPVASGVVAQSDVTISNGELINFDPIKKLSKFISLSELEDINFSTLQNSIMIKDEKVFIPQMNINSSAFDITASGTHNFDNHFEYKVKVNLSEFLAKKARKAKKENDEFGVIEKDDGGRTSLYLSITGTPDDYKIKYDKKEAVQQIKSDLQKEKTELKSVLKNEFGWFRKDSILKQPKKNDEPILDWEIRFRTQIK